MSRRTRAGVVAFVLVIGFAVIALTRPVPYATFRPGPTVNVLGTVAAEDEAVGENASDAKTGRKSEVISIEGQDSYRDGGTLRLLTIVPSGPGARLTIPDVLSAWWDEDEDVYPYASLYSEDDTQESNRERSAAAMMSSQDTAIAAALRALDIDFQDAVRVASVDPDGPAEGKLRVDDVIVAVGEERTASADKLVQAIRDRPVGSEVRLSTLRNEKPREVRVTTAEAVDDPKKSALRVGIAPSFDFPFEVDLQVADNIGGPSGGLMFALGIYELLTPGSLTHGKDIAGTGEIDADGKVGSIGGIRQKMSAAQDAGAHLFLVPADNCAEALAGHWDPDKMRLVKVDTLETAIHDIEMWVDDPDAELTRCTRD